MKLDLNKLEQGFNAELEKSAFLENIIPGMSQLNKLNKGVDYLTGGGLMKDLGGLAMTALPIIGMMGSGGGAPGASGAPSNININLPGMGPKFMEGAAGTVKTFGGAARIPKLAGLLDLNVLKTVLTARAANDAVDAVQGKNRAMEQVPPAPADHREVELTTRYPEIKKILADPQSRAYLESLLTKDASYGT